MENYDQLLGLMQNRHTPRMVDSSPIPDVDVQKIYSAIKTAPSFDRVFPYKVFFLTNSEEGIVKKEQLIEYFRCGGDHVGDPWDDKEILQPLLSGLVIAYVTDLKKLSPTADYGDPETLHRRLSIGRHALKDMMISGTYAMLAARSLGYHTGMFGAAKQFAEAAQVLTPDDNCYLELCVVVAKDVIPPLDISNPKQYYNFKNQNTFVFWNKHKNIHPSTDIQFI
jgi:hypothetical protein